jgi:hypothetical protein
MTSPQRAGLLAAFALLVLSVGIHVRWWSAPNVSTTALPGKSIVRSRENPAPSPRLRFDAAGTKPGSASEISDLHARLQRLLLRADARPSEAVLSFVDADAYRRFLARAQHRGLSVLGQLDALLAVRVRYDSLESLEADLRENQRDFADVAANHYFDIPQRPAREDRAATNEIPFRNTALSFLGVPEDHAQWGRGVRVAVLDSGVSLDATFGSGRLQYLDIGLGTLPGSGSVDGHGTSVASLVAGQSQDAPGTAPGATILSIRVTDSTGRSDLFTVAQAILAAVNAGAPIINLSMGGYATTSALNAAIDYAVAHSALIVASAGNDQAGQLAWPAADPRVISVGAVDARAQQVSFSNSGPQLQITAPGYGVQTAWSEGQRVYVDGTSASAPLVAGAIAALMSQSPTLSAEQASSILRQTASDAGAPGPDPHYGAGVLNLDWAINFKSPERIDPAVASHYYDATNREMNFVVQNRSAQTVRNLSLDVDTNGSTSTFRLPDLTAGADYVVRVPVTSTAARSDLNFTTQLVTPVGFTDANLANNRLSSRLPASPAPAAGP